MGESYQLFVFNKLLYLEQSEQCNVNVEVLFHFFISCCSDNVGENVVFMWVEAIREYLLQRGESAGVHE